QFVANALQPAKVKEVITDPTTQTALVIVPDYQLSLAIGKEGQNARLAARLTGWRIDIKSETQRFDEQRAPAVVTSEAAPTGSAEAATRTEEVPVEGSPESEAQDVAASSADPEGAAPDEAASYGGPSVATVPEAAGTKAEPAEEPVEG
ncbi:MAG: transcription termination factor NusA, partial [Actinomycetota bacterium]